MDRVKWHKGLKCDQYQALPIGERDPDDLQFVLMAREKKWARCPSCDITVDRTHGCNFIKCLCDTGFCYKCSLQYDISKKDDLHQHGKPACNCGLFDVPEEEAALIGLSESFRIAKQRRKNVPKWLMNKWQQRVRHYCLLQFPTLDDLDRHQSNAPHQMLHCCQRTFITAESLREHRTKSRNCRHR